MEYISPLTWVGGKAKHFAKIKKFLPSKLSLFIEPFCGGASVGLNVLQQGITNKIVFNDLNEKLISFWRDDIHLIKLDYLATLVYPQTKTIKELTYHLKQNSCLNAGELFFLNNALTFNGMKAGTWSDLRLKQNFNVNKLKRLAKVRTVLTHPKNAISFYNYDYKIIINMFANNENAYWYLDPPYFYNKGKPYHHLQINFGELKTFILKIKGKWILSLDDSPYIRELFQEFFITSDTWFYSSTNCHNRKPKLGKELFITNFVPNFNKKVKNVISNCMFCHTIKAFDTTSTFYQGQLLKYCQKCANKILFQTAKQERLLVENNE